MLLSLPSFVQLLSTYSFFFLPFLLIDEGRWFSFFELSEKMPLSKCSRIYDWLHLHFQYKLEQVVRLHWLVFVNPAFTKANSTFLTPVINYVDSSLG